MIAKWLVVVQGLLEGGLQLGWDLAFQLGFQVIQQSRSGASPVGDRADILPPFYN